MTVLDSLRTWPVDSVSATIIGAEGNPECGDQDKVYELASVTKLLSAYGVLLAVEEGAIELDQQAGHGAPDGATVRHLLAHASGVGFDSREAQKKVGERRIYSSAGYEILADLVAAETGFSFPDYLYEGVFAPLGMNSTQLRGSAGHGAVSTCRDLAAFVTEVMDPKLLHPDTVAEALTNQYGDVRGLVPGYGMKNPCQWGLGFEIHGAKKPHWLGENMPASTVGHFGMAGTYVWIVPESKIAMVALTDRDFGDWAKPLWSNTNAQVWDTITA
ncbi:Beta-lactamase transpeptidase-like protein [Corynebacterium renale]|uniref:serine hydrolase domain-containing protein n=1 Tax=Corynebacterium renale TaxID=1724 RepID=UPI000DA2C993|nr:serine hydrolase domain-containing protein [Corynebacterium renale]SQG65080.1 Beta-lactamase transpeptidase-like protein [Corynebacterium renale]STC97370.1 Beta-lactamase transpeptidase-like protein [Corynebacterium renale]